MLRISKDLELPDEAVTQTFGILAKRGVGKTYTGSVLVEEMIKSGLKVAVIDPIGVWWGLRTSANGKQKGLQIVIVGGDHGDVPIEPTSGEVIANFVVDNSTPVLIDLSHFRKNQQTQFMTDFAETLYHRNREALHLMIDEADAFAPQRSFRGQERMLGAIEDLVRRGRARGIGVSLITQRPAVLNKNVLTQIEVLITLRLIAPQDQAAIKEWIKVHGTPKQQVEMMESLASLPVGTAWFWSSGWLDVFRKIKVRTKETYDSSSTPVVGEKLVKPKEIAQVDLEKIKEQLSATIEKAKADDPKELKKEIVRLNRELQKQPAQPEVKVEQVKVPVFEPGEVERVEKLFKEFYGLASEMLKKLNFSTPPKLKPMKLNKKDMLGNYPVTVRPEVPDDQVILMDERKLQAPPRRLATLTPIDGEEKPLTGGALRILKVLASRFPMTFTKSQLATLSKLSPRSGTYSTYLSALRSRNLIVQSGDTISLTEEGQAYVGDTPVKPQTTDELLAMWRGNLSGGARRMFDVLVGYYPVAISKDELGQATEMSSSSGTFSTYLSMLRSNGLIEVENGEVKASDSLFL